MKLKFIEAYLHTYLGRDGDRYGLHFNTQNRVPLKYFHLALKQGCQIVLGTAYQNEKNTPEWPQTIPNGHKIYKNGAEIDRMAVQFTNIFHCKTLQNLPKLGFSV
jgi:hypothetical protein